MNLQKLEQEMMNGKRFSRNDDVSFLLTENLQELMVLADHLCRHYIGNKIDLCAIINGKQAGCSENCKFCSQSAHNHSGLEAKPFLSIEEMLTDCSSFYEKGVDRYCVVTAGRGISDADFSHVCEAYRQMHKSCPDFGICASHGHISKEQFQQLKDCGVDRYHENIETSRRYFSTVCSTHTFDDQLETIQNAKDAGLKICCGGIIGMGESWEDRIDMAFTLAEIGVDSIPINALMPVKGTPFGELAPLSENDILRSLCIFRILNPETSLRIAAGRILMADGGSNAFRAGVDSALTGEMLTTAGNNMTQDVQMLKDMGFQVLRYNS